MHPGVGPKGSHKFSQPIASASIRDYCILFSDPGYLLFSLLHKINSLICSVPGLAILGGFEWHLLWQIWFYGHEIFTTVSSCCSSAIFIEKNLKNSYIYGNRIDLKSAILVHLWPPWLPENRQNNQKSWYFCEKIYSYWIIIKC